MAQSGRNKPCTCGSGITHEKCCGKDETAGWTPRVIDGGLNTDGPPLSIDQLNTVLGRAMKYENERPKDDFCGLSPIDMSVLLYHPFDSPGTVEFCTDIKEIPRFPFVELFLKLLNACEGKGMKLTATGNLLRNFCRETALDYYTLDEKFDEKFLVRFISSEPHFDELHTVNIISKMAGYTRKYRGRLLVTKKGQQVLKKGISGHDFLNIVRKYTYNFNWAYRDGYDELRIVQASFLFTLFILKKYGDIFREPVFYNGLFIKAFPMSLNEVPERDYSTPEEDVSSCYSMRSLERFAWFFGFADFNASEIKLFRGAYQIKKTSFLDEFIKFHK
jgi:hypothetical protein